ncbi:hypothetical protein LZ318_01330, partial [Saccharopolyspora indica]
ILKIMRVEPKDELDTAYTSAELAELLVESRREGLIDHSEHRRLAQTPSSADHTVTDVLVPTAELITLPQRPTLGDVERAVAETVGKGRIRQAATGVASSCPIWSSTSLTCR